MATEQTVLDVLDSARSMRWLTEDPVDRELLERLVWAGTRASNPGNSQHWDFVVVTAPDLKKQVQDAILDQRRATARDGQTAAELPTDPVERRTRLGAHNLVQTLHTAPALIFVCAANRYPEQAPVLEWAYSAMHAAAQNMLVAARYLGLGAAFTTVHQQVQPRIREILGIPEDTIIGVTMPVGWPARPFGPVTRRPVEEVLHWEVW